MKRFGNNLVAIDMPSNEADGLIESLNQSTTLSWEYAICVSNNRNSRLDNIARYIKYFVFPFSLFLKRKTIDNLIAWQEFYGIIFAFYCRLFHVKKTTNLLVLTFMYTPKKGILGKIYNWFIHYSVCNKYVDHIVCFSKDELEWYYKEFGFTENDISFLPVAVRRIPTCDTTISKEKYVFSAGRSGRDFDFVIRSLNNTQYNVFIADNKTTVPPASNITIDGKVCGDEMFNIMAHSYCLVTPLKDSLKSAGHLMSLQAMQMGKPVISTDSSGMRPYIVDGYNGFFIKNDKEELLNALNKLYSNDELYEEMSKNALATYDEYSFSKLGERIALLDESFGFLNKLNNNI